MVKCSPPSSTHLHLVHTLLSIPVQERLPLEHGGKLIADTLEELLDRSRITQEGDSHLQSSRRDVALCSKHVVGNPLDEVSRVLVLHVLHLLLDFFHGNFSAEDGRDLCEYVSSH
jgi:hypothetical protein